MSMVPSSSKDYSEPGEEVPIICDSCLGGNPYIRMQKATMGNEKTMTRP